MTDSVVLYISLHRRREDMNRPGFCSICHAQLPHPPAVCPICGVERTHIAGIYGHLGPAHGYAPGRRPHALLLAIARAQVRGWPTQPLIARAAAASLPVSLSLEGATP